MTAPAIAVRQPLPEPESRLVVNGKLNYSECYATFLRDTTQTRDTVEVVAKLLAKLRYSSLFPAAGVALSVADIGCNDASACIDYLDNLPPGTTVSYYGLDMRKAALENARTNLRHHPAIRQINLIRGDAFNGKIQQLKSFRYRQFDLIFISHSAYYVRHQKSVCEKSKHAAFIKDISHMLSDNGIAIFIHGNSFAPFRKMFGAASARDTPALLQRGAALSRLDQLPVVAFDSTLLFEGLDGLAWNELERTDLYSVHRNEPNFVSTLEKLSFIIHQDLARLEVAGTLPAYIDAIKKTLDDNHNCFPITSYIQVVTGSRCTLRLQIATALQEIAHEVQGLGGAARPSWCLKDE